VLFPTIEFAAFFAVVLALNWLLLPHRRVWKWFILVASYFFYGYADPWLVFLLATVTVVNQVGATQVHRATTSRAKRGWLIGAVAIDLGLLGWFKYFNFFAHQIDEALGKVHLGAPLPLLLIVLPIGISFYTFQGIAYVVDAFRGDFAPVGFLDFAVFQSFFPHLVAGPIVRPREFIPQLSMRHDPRAIPMTPALFLIAGGLFKKIVLADYIGTQLVDPVWGTPDLHSGPEVLAAFIGYSVQIYCDFSAYTDIAIGLALLLGFRFPQNFDRPYAASSLQIFWRRWHMSLSRWLRDYLYVPLGGNRRGGFRTYVNLFLTMLLGGLWHGASLTFVVWGGLQGLGLSVERFVNQLRQRRAPREHDVVSVAAVPPGLDPAQEAYRELTQAHAVAERRVSGGMPKPLAVVLTFTFVTLAWVVFRSPTFAVAAQLLGRLGDLGPAPLVTVPVVAAIVAGLSTQFIPARFWGAIEIRVSQLPWWAQALLFAVVLVLIDAIVPEQGVAPFLYFRF
jgi:alginate O-acetyltransferase complex protein AlgI